MTTSMSIAWALVAIVVVAAASPVLAGWTVAFVEGPSASWWRPRSVRWTQVAVVATVAVALAVAAAPAQPRAAWLLMAAGGAALSVIDVRTHRLPLPLTISLATGEALVLAVTAAVEGEPGRLLRAVAAAVVVGAAWFSLVLAAPRSLGLGDVWIAALCAALLGWSSWSSVLAGQLTAWLLAVPLAAVIAATRRGQIGRHMPVPLGPAIIAGAVVAAAWL